MPLFYQPLIPEGTCFLDAEESRHALKVLRYKTGDRIDITDGRGKFYTAIVTEIKQNLCHFRIEATRVAVPKNFSVHIGIAPTKNIDRTEWFVEKATEIGIDEIRFIQCKNSERQVVSLERLIKKAVSGMKQSRQARLPQLHPLMPFDEALEFTGQRFIATIDNSNTTHLQQIVKAGNDCFVLIGPEGDFTNDELTMADEKGFQKVTLGPHTLRTETAGLLACHIINLTNQLSR